MCIIHLYLDASLALLILDRLSFHIKSRDIYGLQSVLLDVFFFLLYLFYQNSCYTKLFVDYFY